MKIELQRSSGGHLLPNLVRFGRLLRGLGLGVTPDQLTSLADGLGVVGVGRRSDVKAAARAVLVSHRDQLPLFDRAFDLFWRAEIGAGRGLELGKIVRRGAIRREVEVFALAAARQGEAENELEEPIEEECRTYSAREVLRRKDFAELTPDEETEVRRLMAQEILRLAPRRTRRRTPALRGPYPDLRRSVRKSLRWGGEMLELAYRRRKEKRRPLIVLCDVSGSMESYTRMLLAFIYTLGTATDRLEAFLFGTRLTRVTRQISHKNVDRALAEATAEVVDWGGGTRIGEALRTFNYEWGRRVLGQGAVVLVISDGWDRGDTELLSREMARLARNTARLVWLNPLLGSPGYRPLTRGIRAALPHVDDFLPVHNLKSLGQLARALAVLEPR